MKSKKTEKYVDVIYSYIGIIFSVKIKTEKKSPVLFISIFRQVSGQIFSQAIRKVVIC